MKVTIHLSLKHGGVPVTNKKNSLYSKKGKYEFVIMCINGLPQDGGGGDKQPQKNLTILPTFPLFGYPVCVKFHSWGPKIRFHVVFHDGS